MGVHDILGIKPVGEAGLKVVEATVEGLSTFLGAIFKPGLEELGFLIKDQVRLWRLNNMLRVLEKAKGRMNFDNQELNLTANARVGLAIMEESSKVDNEELQDMWAGLFVSSCTPDGRDDSNMNFVDLLRRMSSVEARIIDYACRNCKKKLYPNQLITADELIVPFDILVKITGTDDKYRLDSELDHMRSMELLVTGGTFSAGGGFHAGDDKLDANITPSPLALNLFYNTHSTGVSPIDFWKDSLIQNGESDQEVKSPIQNAELTQGTRRDF